MDYSPLRNKLRGLIGGVKDLATHDRLPDLCTLLGLPTPEEGLSKRDRMYAAFDVVPDSDLVRVADKYLSNFPPNAETRNELQELIWAFNPGPEVPIRFRRETAKAIEDQPIYLRSQGFLELLESLFVLEEPHDFLISHPRNLKWQIKQWVVENNDWKADALFENLGAYTCSDRRFLLLIEGLCSSEVRPEVEEQRVLRRHSIKHSRHVRFNYRKFVPLAAIQYLKPSQQEEGCEPPPRISSLPPA